MNLKHNLAVRSDFSIGESTLTISRLIEQAKTHGYESIALVDTMTVSSMVGLFEKAKKEGIKPIVGCTVRVYDDPTYRKPSKESGEKEKKNPFFHLHVYVHDDVGLRSLLKLLSKGNSEDYYYYHARVGLDDVMALENVSIGTGDMWSVFHHPQYDAKIAALKARFPVFVELVPINTPLFDTLNRRACECAERMILPLTASYPTYYATADDADSLDVLRAIATNTRTDSMWLPIPYSRDHHFHDPKDIVGRLASMCDRIGIVDKRTLVMRCITGMEKIVDSCAYEFKKLDPCLPKMADDEFAAVTQACVAGWKERFAVPVFGHAPADLMPYKERLKYELDVLKRMGFSGYFLLVQDIVQWSKGQGIVVGPGRGSVGGSLVAYLMGITDVDPIRFGLLFERFINPSRIDLPDADLDFMSSRRHEVIQYINDKYGKDYVAGVSNYATLGPASALRDVARLSGLNPLEYACSKQVEKEHGVSLSLEESALTVPDIGKYKAEHPDLWDHSTRLEGVMRGLSQHAAGIVVAAEPIINRAVVETRSGGAVVNWDKTIVESWGLIKMDILGLNTLDVLKLAADYIAERHGKRINFLRIPLDEADVMRAFGKGETTGIFQFESAGMKKLLKDLAVGGTLTFDDITAVTALYRPGPIDAGLVDQFVAVKQGEKAPYYEHESLRPSLMETHGVLTYQEQIMRVCQDLAGFTMTDADHVRKAMGKKDLEKMKAYREQFVAGAVKAGMSETSAGMLWEKIEGFAGYAFNKSHAVEYTVISYLAMWLKVRYPAEFFAAAMTVIDKEEKLTGLVLDARRLGIEVSAPDINKSSDRIEIDGEKRLYAPFQSVKGISTNVATHILKVRALHGKPFKSLTEFEAAVSFHKLGAKVNKSHREKLERVGAFASVTPGALPAMHIDRLKDRLELMPGFTVDAVKADRDIPTEKIILMKVVRLTEDIRACDKCALKDDAHPLPRIGKKPKFMVVFDAPNWQEAKKGKLLEGENAGYLKAALLDAGLSANDGYFTSLVKAPKPSGEKLLSMDSIIACSEYLKQEIEILKPPVIVAMGSNAIRYFAPGIKGAPGDLCGKTIYDPKLDASIIFGLNPAQVAFDASKVKHLQAVCQAIIDVIS